MPTLIQIYKCLKFEYLDQKERVDKEAQSIEDNLERLRQELTTLPQPANLEALKKFSAEISRGLLPLENLTLERKRQILELMHVKVIYHPDGQVELDGWFSLDEVEEGLLGGSSSCPAGHWWNPLQPRR
jgi:hypothetical protein